MPFLINLGIFVVVTAALTSTLSVPFLNLHMANSSLAVIKTEVNEIISDNRNSLEDIEVKIRDSLSSHKGFKEINITSNIANDFRVIELEFKYNSLFQGLNDKLGKQKMRFIVNDV